MKYFFGTVSRMDVTRLNKCSYDHLFIWGTPWHRSISEYGSYIPAYMADAYDSYTQCWQHGHRRHQRHGLFRHGLLKEDVPLSTAGTSGIPVLSVSLTQKSLHLSLGFHLGCWDWGGLWRLPLSGQKCILTLRTVMRDHFHTVRDRN